MRDRHVAVCLEPGLVASFKTFLAHNKKVSDEMRYVSAEMLRSVVREAAGDDRDTAEKVIAELEKEVIKDASFVEALQLSQTVGGMYAEFRTPAFAAIIAAIGDVDKLPSISVRKISTGRS